MPYRALLFLRFVGSERDALLPAWASGAYSMSEVDLDLLAAYLQRLRPSTVLEFGCGVSTIRMARVLAEVHGDDSIHVFSVEQDSAFSDECRAKLAAEGLNAIVAHRPLVPHATPSGPTQSYDLSLDFLRSLLQRRTPDLIAIDGPSGGRLVRFPVLPSVQPCLSSETPFLLHDGLRDYELLRVGKAWRSVPGIRVRGILIGGEGFLTGSIAP